MGTQRNKTQTSSGSLWVREIIKNRCILRSWNGVSICNHARQHRPKGIHIVEPIRCTSGRIGVTKASKIEKDRNFSSTVLAISRHLQPMRIVKIKSKPIPMPVIAAVKIKLVQKKLIMPRRLARMTIQVIQKLASSQAVRIHSQAVNFYAKLEGVPHFL